MRKALVIATALLMAAGLGACGEKDEPEPVAPTGGGEQGAQITTTKTTGTGGGGGGRRVSPEAEVQASVIAVLGGNDEVAACSDLVTARYVKRAYGDEQGCRAAVSKRQKIGIAVSAIQIQGKKAMAKAVPAGGPNKGERIKVELLYEGRTWKVDSALSNAPAGP
jgi:hypothetical protein